MADVVFSGALNTVFGEFGKPLGTEAELLAILDDMVARNGGEPIRIASEHEGLTNFEIQEQWRSWWRAKKEQERGCKRRKVHKGTG